MSVGATHRTAQEIIKEAHERRLAMYSVDVPMILEVAGFRLQVPEL